MSMFKSNRFSPMNVGLAAVVLAGLAYVGWSLTGHPNTSAISSYA